MMRYCDTLGLHVNAMNAQGKAAIFGLLPGVLKILNTAVDVPTIAAWREARPDGELILRSVQDNLDTPVTQRCDTLLSQFGSVLQYADIIELPWNECYQTAQELPAYAYKTNTALGYITKYWHKGVGLGMFSTGNPDPASFYNLFVTKIEAFACMKYLCVHEYGAPSMATQGQLHRYRALIAQGILWPVRVTECGIDGGQIGQVGKGYKSYGGGAAYAPQLQDYAKGLAQDNAKGVIFCAGSFSS